MSERKRVAMINAYDRARMSLGESYGLMKIIAGLDEGNWQLAEACAEELRSMISQVQKIEIALHGATPAQPPDRKG